MRTKAIDDINDVQKLHKVLSDEFQLLLLKIVQTLLDAAKVIQRAIENFKPWGEKILAEMECPIDCDQIPGLDEYIRDFQNSQKPKESEFHMSYDAVAQRHFELSQRPQRRVKKK